MNYHTLKIIYTGVVCSTTLTGFVYGLYKLFEYKVGRAVYSSSVGIQDTVGIVGLCTFMGFAGGVTFPVLIPTLLTMFLYNVYRQATKKNTEIPGGYVYVNNGKP